MRPSRNLRLAPPQQNIRMMPLLLRNRPHLIHKRERLLKIRKRKRPHDVMPIHDLPRRNFFCQRIQFLPSQRRHSALARHTTLLRQFAHNSRPPKIAPASILLEPTEPQSSLFSALAPIFDFLFSILAFDLEEKVKGTTDELRIPPTPALKKNAQ